MEGARKLLANKINEIDPKEITHGFLQILNSIWLFMVEKFNQILPPETRSQTLHHWAHVGLFVVLPVFLLLLCLYRCCCGEIRLGPCLRRCFCCCCCFKSRDDVVDDDDDFEALLRMRAPGRYGEVMPRNFFESNPRGYFRDLRAKKPLPNYYY